MQMLFVKTAQNIEQIIKPSIIELANGLVLLVILVIASRLSNTTELTAYNLQDIFVVWRILFESILRDGYFNIMFNALVWSLLGLLAYSTIWIVSTIAHDVRSSIAIHTAFIHPDHMNNMKKLQVVFVKRSLIIINALIAMLFFVFLVQTIPIVTTSLTYFSNELQDDTDLAVSSLLLPALWFVGWHLLIMLIRIYRFRSSIHINEYSTIPLPNHK